ncbi:hypothetical protein HYPSUDRAFT_35937 [Hypholoma sublateritium FD-334 SS-4]|uniref:methionine--tRNA ligase n=1 Tax=Hypholoma sublateritium (strain FD-334 SS-4) TaxID=945553 RepID=A0A0D2MS30_HYPSF|nr:hypothetical protein HYPSUDRAFT_35937 [Hypholoma sublateritium FD-334 SS-4]
MPPGFGGKSKYQQYVLREDDGRCSSQGCRRYLDECFYTDAQVGPAPTSGPTQNSEPQYVSLETGAAVEWSAEENYMFRLSAFRSALASHILSSQNSIYPPQYRSQVLGWLGADGADPNSTADLEDISISRPASRLSWGVPVPQDPTQTVYVWFDALLIYLSGAGYPWRTLSGVIDTAKMHASGWPADVQVVGKDILRFHALYLPAILLALNAGPYAGAEVQVPPVAMQDIPLPRTLLAHAHWTASGRKMSKSVGNVVDPLAEMELWGVDGVRFYLMRIGGRWRGDVDWSAEQLEKHHKELSGQLGNYFLRMASPRIAARAVPLSQNAHEALSTDLQQLFKSSDAPSLPAADTDPNYEQLRLTRSLPARVAAHMETCEVGAALAEIVELLKHANKSVSEIEPWARTTPPALVHTTRIVGLETLRVAGACLLPFIPEAAARLLASLDGGTELVRSSEVLAPVRRTGPEDMEAFWQRWNGREVEGVKLF